MLKSIDCGYPLEPPRRGGSNECPQSMLLSRDMNNIRIFIWKLSVFGGEVFNIFEYVWFRNGLFFYCCSFCVQMYILWHLFVSLRQGDSYPHDISYRIALHYENTPIQIYRKFHLQNLKIFRYKNSDIFHTSAQNIDCGYSLEPPRRGGSNEYPQSMFWAEIWKIMYTSVNPSFTI